MAETMWWSVNRWYPLCRPDELGGTGTAAPTEECAAFVHGDDIFLFANQAVRIRFLNRSSGYLGKGYCHERANMARSVTRAMLQTFLRTGTDQIFVMDGYNGLSRYQWYDVSANTWTAVTDVQPPSNIYESACLYFPSLDKCFMPEGSGDRNGFVEFDPSVPSWTEKTDMPFDAAFFCAGVIGSKAYIADGAYLYDDTNRTYEYDPASHTFTAKANCPDTHQRCTGAVLDGILYKMGDNINSEQCHLSGYDPASNTWTSYRTIATGTRYGENGCPRLLALESAGMLVMVAAVTGTGSYNFPWYGIMPRGVTVSGTLKNKSGGNVDGDPVIAIGLEHPQFVGAAGEAGSGTFSLEVPGPQSSAKLIGIIGWPESDAVAGTVKVV